MTPLDLSVPGRLFFALGPDLVLAAGAMILLLFSVWRRESEGHARAVGIGALVVVLLTAGAIVYYLREFPDLAVAPGPIALDRFRWYADLIFLLGTGLAIALALDYNGREGILAGEAHVLMLLATSGMMLLAAARDLMLVFLGIELMSISTYALAGLDRRSYRSAEAALKYFLLGAFSTGFLLYGIAMIYGATGTTNIPEIGRRVVEAGLTGHPMLLAGIALLLVGFGFKVAAAPFHMWAPDAYEGAPTPVTAFMAAAVKAAAFAALLRIWLEGFREVWTAWHPAVWWLAVLTMIVGNVVALSQRNIKRLLAYSSIAHAGYLLVAVISNSGFGTTAFLFYLLAYTLATMGAFGVVVALGRAGEPNEALDDYAGLWTLRPGLSVAMAVFMLALLGFPFFGGIGFLGKWYLLQAALAAPEPQTWLAVILVLASVISAGYYLYVIMLMFMRPRRADAPAPGRSGGFTGFVVAATAAAILLVGLYPQPVLELIRRGEPAPPQLTSAVPPLPVGPSR